MKTSRAITSCLTLALALMGLSPAVGASEEPTISTAAGLAPRNRPATAISLHPSGLAFDDAGNLFVADTASSMVWKVTPDGKASAYAGHGRPCPTTPESCLEHNGDGGPATEARLFMPYGLAVMPDGDVVVSERAGHRVRRIDAATGTISTYAGSGSMEYLEGEDGGPATAASIFMPAGLAVDSVGNLYIADMGNYRVRKVDPSGTISTVAGCGPQRINTCDNSPDDGRLIESTYLPFTSLSPLAVDAQDRLHLAVVGVVARIDDGVDTYRRIAGKAYREAAFPGDGEDGPALDASFRNVGSMAFAPNGDLLLTDAYWSRVQRVTAPGTGESVVRHVAGCSCGTGDSAGNGYSGDGGPARIAKLGLAFRSGPNIQGGIAVSGSGDVLFSDIRNNRVRLVDAGGTIRTIVGNGLGSSFDPGLGVHDFSADSFNENQVRNVQGGFSGDGLAADQAQLLGPYDVEVDQAGNVYVLETHANRVRRIRPGGRIETVAGSGCLSDNCTNRGSSAADGPALSAFLTGATAIALDRTGTQLYIADAGHSRVRQVNLGKAPFTTYPVSSTPITIPPGGIATIFGDGIYEIPCCGYEGAKACFLLAPYCGEGLPAGMNSSGLITGIAADGAGNIYVADAGIGTVRRIDGVTGHVVTFVGKPHASNCDQPAPASVPAAAARLCGPTDLTFGPDGDLYVSESGWEGFAESLSYGIIDEAIPQGSRIVRVDMQAPGFPTTVVAGASGIVGSSGDGGQATAARVAYPHGVGFDAAGNTYIADTGNARIRKVAPDGTITTFAGSGNYLTDFAIDGCGVEGDGGPARSAKLCAPMGIASGPDGTMYVADYLNNRIRQIELSGGA